LSNINIAFREYNKWCREYLMMDVRKEPKYKLPIFDRNGVNNMETSDYQWQFLQEVGIFIGFCVKNNYKLTGGHLKRLDEQQQIYYDAGKSWTLDSDHELALAIDFNFFIDDVLDYGWDDKGNPTEGCEDVKLMGMFWKCLSRNNYWGGDCKGKRRDSPHFGKKMKPRRTIKQQGELITAFREKMEDMGRHEKDVLSHVTSYLESEDWTLT